MKKRILWVGSIFSVIAVYGVSDCHADGVLAAKKIAVPLHLTDVNNLEYLADGKVVVSDKSAVKVLDPETGKEIRSCQKPPTPVFFTELAPDRKTMLIYLSAGGQVNLVFCDLETGASSPVLQGIRRMILSPDKSLAVTFDKKDHPPGQPFQLWKIKEPFFDQQKWELVSSFNLENADFSGGLGAFKFSSDSKFIVIGSGLYDLFDQPPTMYNHLHIFSVEQKKVIQSPAAPNSIVYGDFLLNDSSQVVAIWGTQIRLFDVSKGSWLEKPNFVYSKPASCPTDTDHFSTALVRSPDGKRVLIDDFGQYFVTMWDAQTGKLVAQIEAPHPGERAFKFGKDSDTVLNLQSDGSLDDNLILVTHVITENSEGVWLGDQR